MERTVSMPTVERVAQLRNKIVMKIIMGLRRSLFPQALSDTAKKLYLLQHYSAC